MFKCTFVPAGLDYPYQIEVTGHSEIHTLSRKLLMTSRPGVDAFTRAVKAAQNLYDSSDHPIVLCLSGGLDSQAMLSAFTEARVKFKVCFFHFHNDLNGHEFDLLRDYCESVGVAIETIDVDIIDFFESGQYYEIALKAQTNSPLFAAHAWLAEKVDGLPVFSGQAWTVQKEAGIEHKVIDLPLFEKRLVYVPALKEYCVHQFLLRSGRTCVSHFFHRELELLQAFWRSPFWLNVANTSIYNHAYDYQHKYFAYLSSGFPLVAPARMAKLTGFERVHLYFQKTYKSGDQYHFNELFRRPLEKLFPVRDELIVKFK